MINAVLILALGVVAGYHYRTVRDEVRALDEKFRDQHPPLAEPTVTATSLSFINENRSGHTDSRIIEPKSPQLIDWEEQQELERINKTVKVKPR